jgi:PhnB protein
MNSMALSPHLSFAGECAEAFRFYAEVFGGELMLLPYRDTPLMQNLPEGWADKIVHATLTFQDCTLAGSDVVPERYRQPQGFAVLVDVEGVANARQVFAALAEGGKVEVPIEARFWSPAYGMVVDKFGVPWEINGAASASEGNHDAE